MSTESRYVGGSTEVTVVRGRTDSAESGADTRHGRDRRTQGGDKVDPERG